MSFLHVPHEQCFVDVFHIYLQLAESTRPPAGDRAARSIVSALRASVRRIYHALRSNSLGIYGPLSGFLLAIALRALLSRPCGPLSAVFIALRARILLALAGLCKKLAFTRWRQIFIALRARILSALVGLCKEVY